MARGNWTERRGRPTRVRFSLTEYRRAALRLKLIAWLRYRRPTSDEETEATLAALINEEYARVRGDAPPPMNDEAFAALRERIERMNEEEDSA